MANHLDMTKYQSENDEGYKKMSGHLQLIVSEANPKVQLNRDKEELEVYSMIILIYSTNYVLTT